MISDFISRFLDSRISRLGFKKFSETDTGIRYIKDIDNECNICVDLILRYRGKSVLKMHSFSYSDVLWDCSLNYSELFLFSLRLHLLDHIAKRGINR